MQSLLLALECNCLLFFTDFYGCLRINVSQRLSCYLLKQVSVWLFICEEKTVWKWVCVWQTVESVCLNCMNNMRDRITVSGRERCLDVQPQYMSNSWFCVCACERMINSIALHGRQLKDTVSSLYFTNALTHTFRALTTTHQIHYVIMSTHHGSVLAGSHQGVWLLPSWHTHTHLHGWSHTQLHTYVYFSTPLVQSVHFKCFFCFYIIKYYHMSQKTVITVSHLIGFMSHFDQFLMSS